MSPDVIAPPIVIDPVIILLPKVWFPSTVKASSLLACKVCPAKTVKPRFALIKPDAVRVVALTPLVAVIEPHDVIFPLVPSANDDPVIPPHVIVPPPNANDAPNITPVDEIDALSVLAFLYGPIKDPEEGTVIVPDAVDTSKLPAVTVIPLLAVINFVDVNVPVFVVIVFVFPSFNVLPSITVFVPAAPKYTKLDAPVVALINKEPVRVALDAISMAPEV